MPEDVRLAEQSRTAVGFLFGVLIAEALPGPVLVQLMAILGFAEPTTRQLLARMLRHGDLVAERVGRVSVYRLAGRYLQQWLRLRHGDSPAVWQGGFHLVLHDLPERYRRARETLQAAAVRAGFGQLRPGALVGLDEPGFVRELLETPHWPAGAGLVETGWLEVDLGGARRIAVTAWRLSAAAEDLRQARAGLEQVLAQAHREPGDGAAALRLLFQAIRVSGSPRYSVPVLPEELLPSDWPAEGVQQLLMKVVDQLRPPVGEYLFQLLSESRHAGLVRGGWWPEVSAQVEAAVRADADAAAPDSPAPARRSGR